SRNRFAKCPEVALAGSDRWSFRWTEGPFQGVIRFLSLKLPPIDPFAQDANFSFGQRLSGSGRRHTVAGDFPDQEASLGESFHDDRAAVTALQQGSCCAQVQACHRLVLSVALHAPSGEDGENLLVEARALLRGLFPITGWMIGRSARCDPAFQSLDIGIGN